MDANRILIEPKFLNDFPINAKRLDFIMKCIENNFDNLQLHYGDFESMNLMEIYELIHTQVIFILRKT